MHTNLLIGPAAVPVGMDGVECMHCDIANALAAFHETSNTSAGYYTGVIGSAYVLWECVPEKTISPSAMP